jgi:2-C-methyl-D-erythritol 2,4-cyclodiphosphate synthase
VREPTPDDLRVGLGFDVHARASDRELWLGGVRFDVEDGLGGHSDGDAVCHALADAMLGAAGLGDIGTHFPDDDPSTEGIAGVDVVAGTSALLAERGMAVRSFDLTVIADHPSIASRREEMRGILAAAAAVAVDHASVKATRPEGLGLTGDGVGCVAVVTVAPAPEP